MRQAHAALGARGVPLAANQVEYSLLHRQPETNGVLDACRELGVTPHRAPPLAGGMLTGKYGRESPDRVLQTRPSQVSPQISRRHPTRGWAPPRDRRSIFEDPEPSGLAVVDRESDRAAHPWRQERQAGSEQRSRPQLLVESRRSRRPERCDSSLEGLTPGPAIRGSIDPCRSNDSEGCRTLHEWMDAWRTALPIGTT